MWWIAPFAFLFLVAILGGVFVAAARVLGRMILSASLALLIGVVTAMACSPQDDSIAIGALLALALIAPIFWLLTPRASARRQANPTPPPSTAGVTKTRRRSWLGAMRQSSWASAWTRLQEIAPDHAARLLVARRSCERFESQCEERRFDLEAHRSLVIIRRRMPELITQELERAQELSRTHRTKLIEDLVELVERVAADCERRLVANRDVDTGNNNLLRRHVENYLAGDALSPLNP